MIVVIFSAVLLTHGVTIQCNFQNYDFGQVVGTQYACLPAIITSDGNLTHVIDVTGNHLSGKTNADVKAFYIGLSHEHLNRIPKGIERFFPNLIVFGWTYGNLATLTADDLKPFSELQVLYAYWNKMVSLDEDLFKHTPELKYIHFGANLLEHVGFGLLDGLNNLTNAYFLINPCIDFFAETPAAIQELTNKLQNQCPPLGATTTSTAASSTSTTYVPMTTIGTSTESGECSIECVELIETLEEENKRQDGEIAAQADEITLLTIAIKELEKQIKELWVRP